MVATTNLSNVGQVDILFTKEIDMGRSMIKEMSSEKLQLTLHGAPLTAPHPPLSAGAIEARALIEKAKQLKEKEMQATIGEQLRAKFENASKAEALKSTLNEWDADEQKQIKGEAMQANKPHVFGVTNNASRDTFNFVRNNPGRTISELKKGLSQHKGSTVSALAYQMVVVGMFRKDENTRGFYAIVPEFIPYNINKIRKERRKKTQQQMQVLNEAAPKKVIMITRRKAKPEQDAITAGIGALTVNTDQQVTHTLKWKPQDTVDQLTLVQAKAVHAYLQQVFGAL